MRRKRYFDWEQAFHFIWENVDCDGIWHGDAASLAAEFEASEGAAEEVLRALRSKHLIEKLDARTHYLSKWREKDDPRPTDQ